MADFYRKTTRSFMVEMTPRLLRAMLASVAAAVIVYLSIMYVALPALLTSLTPAHIEWLRDVFAHRPLVVLGAIVALAAVLALPVFGAFRLVYGPLSRAYARRNA